MGLVQCHRVEYDDGDTANEDLRHRTYRLPNLKGDQVFNPDADAESPMYSYSVPGSKPGAALIGQRIEVWWAQDEAFYAGVIKSYKRVGTSLVAVSVSVPAND